MSELINNRIIDDAVAEALQLDLGFLCGPGLIRHVPFALTPAVISRKNASELERASPLLGRLTQALAQDEALIESLHAPLAVGDPFFAELLSIHRELPSADGELPRLPLLRAPMYCFQVISHKFLRWSIGPSLTLILPLNLLLLGQGPLYRWLFAAQAAYYLLTALALGLGRIGMAVPVLSGLVFFNSTNLAYVVSLVRFLTGKRMARWAPPR